MPVAELSDALPVALVGQFVVREGGVMVGRGDEPRDLPWVLGEDAHEGGHIVPGDAHDVLHIRIDDAVVAGALHPRGHAVVAALDGDDLLAPGGGARDHQGVAGHVAAVLGEESPAGERQHVDHLLGQLHHHRAGGAHGVAGLALPRRSLVHDLVVVAEHHGPVGAHVVDELVAVDVGEPRALAALGVERVAHRRDQQRRAEVPVDAARDHPGGTREELLGLREGIGVHGVTRLLRWPGSGTWECGPARGRARRSCRSAPRSGRRR